MANEATAFRQSVDAASVRLRAQVLYDGHCLLCLKSVNLLRRLDWLQRLRYVDVRTLDHPQLDSRRLLQEMHLIPPSPGQVYSGFRAFRWMAWRLPALWLLAPFLYVPGIPGLGQRLYLWVARNRFRLVPCHGGVCTLPGNETPVDATGKHA